MAGILRGDRTLSLLARSHPASPAARLAARLFSPWPAAAQGLVAAAVMRRAGRPAAGVALAPGVAVAVSEVLKRVAHRKRPGLRRFRSGGRRSFPSSHVAGPSALVAAAWFDVPSRTQITLAAGLGACVAALALERLEAGAHWPSDIVTGVVLGATVGGVLGRMVTRKAGRAG